MCYLINPKFTDENFTYLIISEDTTQYNWRKNSLNPLLKKKYMIQTKRMKLLLKQLMHLELNRKKCLTRIRYMDEVSLITADIIGSVQ